MGRGGEVFVLTSFICKRSEGSKLLNDVDAV